MSLTALDGSPLSLLGVDTIYFGNAIFPAAVNATIDAANEACQFIGHVVTEDGASHTIDTSGSSALQWRTAAVTFAQAGTTVKVGLATLDAATGPAARATNVADVVTYSVSKSMVGNVGGITANAWQSHVPDAGSLSVANGDLLAFVIQATARAAADSIIVSGSGMGTAWQRPAQTAFAGGAYSAQAAVPNCMIIFADGTRGWFAGSSVWSTASTTQTWNSGSAQAEYGNYFLRPYPTKVHGLVCNANFTADCDLVLYTDPLGTPSPAKTISVDTNQTNFAANRWGVYLFASPLEVAANQPLAAIFKPGGSNVSAAYKTFNAAADAKSETCGTNCYAVSRASGAFAAVNSNKDRFGIGLLVGAFEAGGGGGAVFGGRGGVVI